MATKAKPRTAAATLKNLRDRRGLTQMQLKKLTGVSQALISQIENGTKPMTYATASQLERGLKLERGALDDVVGLPGMCGYIRSRRRRPYTHHVSALPVTSAGRIRLQAA